MSQYLCTVTLPTIPTGEDVTTRKLSRSLNGGTFIDDSFGVIETTREYIVDAGDSIVLRLDHRDAAGNVSQVREITVVAPSGADTTAPSQPGVFIVTFTSYTPPPPPSGAVLASPALTSGVVTFGLVLPSGQASTALKLGTLATQTDVRNRWPDGSIRHALLSASIPSAGTYEVTEESVSNGTFSPTWPTVVVDFLIAGTTYTASLGAFDATNTVCDGAICRRAWKMVTPGAHPSLQVVFEITSYITGGHKVSICIQNIRNVPEMNQVTADVTTTINGAVLSLLTKSNWTIYTGQRWHRSVWVDAVESEVTHDFEPWIAANVIPRIVDADPKIYDLASPPYQLGGGSQAGSGWRFGEATGNQGDSENADRQELNPWCDWEARLFLTGEQHYLQTVLANGNQAGAWTWAVDRAGDGKSILRLDQDGNAAAISTDRAAPIGLAWSNSGPGAWTGALDGDNVPGYPSVVVQVDREHLPEMCFVPHLLTGDSFYLDQLRFVAAWAAFMSYGGMVEKDPNVWPGFIVGRNGAQGLLSEAELGRSFGRPFKQILRAAWACPDSSTDKVYFHGIADNNLTAVENYINYINGRGWTGGSWAGFVGFHPGATGAWGYLRGNSVSSTAPGTTTVFTVVGDGSGVGTDTNDHGMQTGDFVDLSGFAGAEAVLNGHYAITRLGPTQFSIAIPSESPTTGVGTWSTSRGLKSPPWRIGVGAREVSWALRSGLWNATPQRWEFPDRVARTEMAMQDNPAFDTAPGVSHNYYPSPCKVMADNLTFFTSWTEYHAANTDYLFDSELTYTLTNSSTHCGNVQGWNETNPNTYYTIYAFIMLAHARNRGLAGADAAATRLENAAGVKAELKRRPGFYYGV